VFETVPINEKNNTNINSFLKIIIIPHGFSFSKPSPDHSTFSHFRSRLSKAAMKQINSKILRQFQAKELSINEGWITYKIFRTI
jgi:hypothetical protein